MYDFGNLLFQFILSEDVLMTPKMGFVLSLVLAVSESRNPSPVIIVPGLGGSEAYATQQDGTTFKVWCSPMFQLLPNFLIDYMGLRYNFDDHTTSDQPGIKVNFPGFGSMDNIASMYKYIGETYTSFMTELQKNTFYVNNYTLRGAPFDFRKLPYENQKFFLDLENLVQETYKNAGNRRVVFMCHSLGCLYSLKFLKQMTKTWKKMYLRAFVSVGAPLGGTPEIMEVMATGKLFPLYATLWRHRDYFRSQPSMYMMWPNSKYFPKNKTLIKSPQRSYSSVDYKELFTDLNFTQGIKILEQALSQFDPDEDQPYDIDEVYCIYSTGLDTIEVYEYGDYTGVKEWLYGAFPDHRPSFIYGNGDAAVSVVSLKPCEKWDKVKTFVVENVDHGDYFSNHITQKILVQILENGDS